MLNLICNTINKIQPEFCSVVSGNSVILSLTPRYNIHNINITPDIKNKKIFVKINGVRGAEFYFCGKIETLHSLINSVNYINTDEYIDDNIPTKYYLKDFVGIGLINSNFFTIKQFNILKNILNCLKDILKYCVDVDYDIENINKDKMKELSVSQLTALYCSIKQRKEGLAHDNVESKS